MQTIVRLCECVGAVMTWVAVATVMLLALPIAYDATARAFGHPTIWVFETTLYALIVAGFLASPSGMKTGAHFRVVVLAVAFPRLRPWLNVFSLLMTLLFSVILVSAGSFFVWYSYTNNILSASLLEVPVFLPQLAIPIGGVGLFLQTLALLLTGREPGQGAESARIVAE